MWVGSFLSPYLFEIRHLTATPAEPVPQQQLTVSHVVVALGRGESSGEEDPGVELVVHRHMLREGGPLRHQPQPQTAVRDLGE